MNKILIISLIALLFHIDGKSQTIKSAIVNEKCKCKATLLDSIITEFKKSTGQPINDDQVLDNQINVQERIDFLNSDFKTKVFSQACEVKCTDFTITHGPHLGIIDIGIEKKDKNKCLQVIGASQRNNFQIKALTRFKVIERNNELVIVYSETPYDRVIERLFEENK